MFQAVSLWSQRRKLRSSIARDPLSPQDPAAWLDGAGTVLELRTRCPEPGWLAHCAYWAGVPMRRIAMGAVGVASQLDLGDLLPVPAFGLTRLTHPELAEIVLAAEDRHPQIRGIEQFLPHQFNSALATNLPRRRPGELVADELTPDALLAGGVVLLAVTLLHLDRGLRESLVLTAGAAATLFAIARPEQRGVILEAQRIAYEWSTSMTSVTFTR